MDQDTKVSTEYQELTLEGFDTESSNQTSMKNNGKTGTVKPTQAPFADWIYTGSIIVSQCMWDNSFSTLILTKMFEVAKLTSQS